MVYKVKTISPTLNSSLYCFTTQLLSSLRFVPLYCYFAYKRVLSYCTGNTKMAFDRTMTFSRVLNAPPK